MKNENITRIQPGPVILFGSGETSASGRRVFDQILADLPSLPKLALLETPAGFEPNSTQVIGRVADFLTSHLKNYHPDVVVVNARARGTEFSPDDPVICAPLLEADLIFMGPGSPSYAVRQLKQSMAWQYTLARHRLGAVLVLASAATIAVSAHALPVYELYKVGEDLHWKQGLDFFSFYGMPLIFIPHWNNRDGGTELDTSCCYMGKERFARLLEMLPSELTVMGIDEHTAMIIDIKNGLGHVVGSGGVTVIHTGHQHQDNKFNPFGNSLDEAIHERHAHIHIRSAGESFSLAECCTLDVPPFGEGVQTDIWQRAIETHDRIVAQRSASSNEPPPLVLDLVEQRRKARESKDWVTADIMREEIAAWGWDVRDTSEGPELTPVREHIQSRD